MVDSSEFTVAKFLIYLFIEVHLLLYQLIPLHSCEYLCDYFWNEMWQWTNDKIGVAVQSWLWVRVELMTW